MVNMFLHYLVPREGVTDAWDGILKYQLDINHKPCNFVELFPRLKEK
jgi:molybdenum cofactor biosynthesis protein B